jgi:hypothetical protein
VASPDGVGRPLTDFEQILLGVIDGEPRSGYGLKKCSCSALVALAPDPIK